jgi:DNA-binding Xre family transcriptional regulator
MVEMLDTAAGRYRVAVRLEEARRRRGIRSWAEVARLSGLHQNSISELTSGKVSLGDVRIRTLVKLCAALGVRLDELVEITPVQPGPGAVEPQISQAEFAEAVAAVLAAPPPSDWVGPTEEDLDEAEPVSVEDLAARWRGRDGFQQRFERR